MPKIRDINLDDLEAASVSQEMVLEYKDVIQGTDLKNAARELTFEEGESISRGKMALVIAAKELGVYLKIAKRRGKDVLIFREITRKEHDQLEKARNERTEKMREARAGKK